jgi:WD40 repeat protein
MVLLYTMDGRVGLSIVRDDQALPLEASGDPSVLAAIPARGFALLAARFGVEDKWADVTAAVRSRLSGGRLDFIPAQANLADPAPGSAYSLAIAYANGGKVGLWVQAQWRSPNLPFDAPPINSDSLLARSIEFPQKPSIAAFTPDSRYVVVGVEDGSIRMIDATTGREAHRFDRHTPGWLAVAVSGNGSLVASGGADSAVRVWDVKTDREKVALRGHTQAILRIAFSPTNHHVASTAWDKTVRLWDATAGRELRKFEGHTDLVVGVKFTPDGRQLVTASWDRTVRVWDVATGREVRKIQTNGDALEDVGVSKTGRDIFFGSKDGIVRWWEPLSKREPVSFPTNTQAEIAIAPLPDGHRVLMADKIAAALWDCKTTHPVVRLEMHTHRVTGVAVAPNGQRAATCAEDKTLKIWNLPELGR